MGDMPHAQATRACLQGTVGDAVIMLLAYTLVALAARGLWAASWTYQPTMPLLPGTGVGLVPLLQWVVLPLLTVWFARRQLAGRVETCARDATAS